jgi:predicted TIM-barrel fold metal-dependent hydrolase
VGRASRATGRPRRRDLLVGGAGAAALAVLGRRTARASAPSVAPAGAPSVAPAAAPSVAPAAAPAVGVDVHCHTFCSADLPIVGFVAHFIPGLTDLSRLVTHWPELVVRTLVGAVATLPNAVAPTGDEELARLRALLARRGGAAVSPVPPLPSEALDALLAQLTKHLPFSVGADKRRIVARYLEALYLVAHPRAGISATLAQMFPSVSLFTPALVDYDAWSEDRAPTPLWTQILIQEAVARLSIEGRIGRPDARFHPFVAFDPRRDFDAGRPASAAAPAPTAPAAAASAASAAPPAATAPKAAAPPTAASPALELVRYAIESAGFLGVKLYPPVGFAPLDNLHLRSRLPFAERLDEALSALYAYCQAAEVPITTHASAANEYGLGLHTLVAPERWRPVLERYPTLRLNFGHFGHDYGVEDRGAPKETATAWIYQAAALIERYPNVYADLSNSPLVYDPVYATRLLGLLGDVIARYPKVKRRLMYGSDWWLSRLDPEADTAVGKFRATFARLFDAGGVGEVMGGNALRFLGFLDDAGQPRSGPAAARLRRFYGGAALPLWLPRA